VAAKGTTQLEPPSPAEILCILHGDNTPFSVDTNETQNVSALQRTIKANQPGFDTVTQPRLKLYYINVPFDESRKYLEAVQEISRNLSKCNSLDRCQ